MPPVNTITEVTFKIGNFSGHQKKFGDTSESRLENMISDFSQVLNQIQLLLKGEDFKL